MAGDDWDDFGVTKAQHAQASSPMNPPELFQSAGVQLDRRLLISSVLLASPLYALVREARAAETVSDRRLSAKLWIDRQDELARGMRAGAISPLAWHDEVNRLASEVDVAQLLAEAGRSQTLAGEPFMRDPVKRSVHFLDDEGQPRRLNYAAATFSFGQENVITPHAHEHMASAHMVIRGKVRIRTFDRVESRADALVIRPTADHIGEVGSAAAMTSTKDNIHWFAPATPAAMTFDVIVDGLDKGEKDYVIQPVDPLGGDHRADGTIVAPILSFEASMQRYSAHV
jgi:hypothetical protein